ncbi:hypothetical protein OKA05_22450 [Luteolibacter arcticus]|uniref:Autotransporter-associated beta strand repeat-containing protein n=1 Tax=Luteolibacter arcticus TaxID=1581411 RepID=A0ABT3GPF6_9BACT|nr:hypothetical protein [Luteolibacter arcticus]
MRAALSVSAIALAAAGSSNAAPCVWIGNTDASWTTPDNWDFTPVNGDDLIFNAAGTAGTTLNNDLTAVTVTLAGITFNAPAPAYLISGNAFTLSTGITNNSAEFQTISDAITLSGATTFTAPGGGGISLGAIRTAVGSSIDLPAATPLTLASLNGGPASNNRVNVTSAGNLTVTGSFHVNNNVNGAASFTQTAGTVTLGSAVDDVATFGEGISIAFRAAATTQNTYFLQGGTLNVPNANLYVTVGGGARALLNITSGTANLRGIGLSGTSATANGSILITGGRLNLGANGLVRGATTAGTVTLGAGTVGALADWSSPAAMILNDAIAGVTFNTTDPVAAVARTITLSGVLSGAGALNTAGLGGLTLSGLNTYSGNTTVNGGTLTLADNARLTFVIGATSGATNTLSGAGTVFLNGDFAIDTTAASALNSGSWTLENVPSLPGAYGTTFTVLSGFADAGGDKWTKTDGSKLWTFDETTGVLTLATSSGYGAWAATNAGGGTANADFDKDGVANAVEYVLGGSGTTNDAGKLPDITISGGNMVFEFVRDRASKTPDTVLRIEVGTTLATWPTSYTVGVSQEVMVTENPNGTDTITASVPQAGDTVKFARLRVDVTL